MAQPQCNSCGRPLNPTFAPNGENPCRICIPRKPNGKPVAGVSPVSVLKEDLSQRTPEAVEAKQAAQQSDGTCRGTTAQGKPCSNKDNGSGYCYLHDHV